MPPPRMVRPSTGTQSGSSVASPSPDLRRNRADILRDIGGLLIPAVTIISVFGFPVYIFASLGARVATGLLIAAAAGSFVLYRSRKNR
jgi:hypothetical protein